MGLAMANNLQRHLAAKKALSLLYSNRTMSRGGPLQALGGTPEPSFPNLVSRCGIIFTMVSFPIDQPRGDHSHHANTTTKANANATQISNDAVLKSILASAIGSGASLKDKIFVDCSTVHPETVSAAAAQLKEEQASFVAAPVFGGKPIAVDGKLVFAIGGPKNATEVVKPLIQDVMGRKVIECGEDATKSSLLKIAGYVFRVGKTSEEKKL